ncbi:uncharacterized protein LOC124643715 isoform X2 [Helicoverpa zea]|uniref:uncharacterized protein LOC124629526 isoform X4 n=1 Tax=Helicoverpa zea TaxID=7113 RepID=UPI001F56CC57|nr:uncharacterized protein LOC124629526 isoform X4 [Helicoverpa zea]XP_047038715.1 uncharacterized protein LOC124643715 isoform X2 [Helicoverpa zea]
MESKSTTITTAAAPVAFGLTEGLIEKFSGDDKSYSSSKWAQDIEDNAEIFQWTPQQTLIVARRSLTGTAELWLKSEKAFKTYGDLKAALVKEFPDTANVKEMHELMAARKKLKGETYYQYMLHMKELARRAKFPDYIAIQYIVDGIDDYESNKVILYGVTTFPALKEKLAFYEKMKSKTREREKRTERLKGHARSAEASSAASGSARRCYSCGDMGHEAGVCKNGLKCFGCNQFGHIRNQCPVNPMRSTATASASGHSGAKMAGAGGSGAHGGRGGGASGSGEAGKLGPKRPAAMFGTVNEVSGNEAVRAVIDNETSLTLTDVNTVNVTATSYEDRNVNITHVNKCVRKPVKDIKINNTVLNALVDSGSDVNLLSLLYLPMLNAEVASETLTMSGLGRSEIQSRGSVSVGLEIDNQCFNGVVFHLVPPEVMPYDVIIGQEFLGRVTVVMNEGGIRFFPIGCCEWVGQIDCFPGCVAVNVDHIQDPAVRSEVMQCVEEYKPLYKEEAPIQLQIVLKDDIPVRQRPRRLSLMEQQVVEDQIEEWLDKGIVRVSEESIKYTSFVTHHGQFEFLRAPFGLSTCPKTFMRFPWMKFRLYRG